MRVIDTYPPEGRRDETETLQDQWGPSSLYNLSSKSLINWEQYSARHFNTFLEKCVISTMRNAALSVNGSNKQATVKSFYLSSFSCQE